MFATYLHPETAQTSRPVGPDMFVGHSYPYFSQVRQELSVALADYPNLPLRKADLDTYLSVHTADYLDKMKLMADDQPVDPVPKWTIECTGYQYCLPGYQYGLGGMFEAIDQMKAGTLERAFCFCLGGHHAFEDWGHGYCVLNPMAVAVRYAQSQGFEKIVIIDWDIHHGDGTQAIFANAPSVYCLSIHSAADIYMSMASSMRRGTTTAAQKLGQCNIPLLHNVFDDDFFEQLNLSGDFYRAEQSIAAFQDALQHLPFSPDLTCIFAGADSHLDDGGKNITNWVEDDFQTLTRLVLEVSGKADCPVLSAQGGGYNLPTTISTAAAHVAVLSEL